MMKMRMERRGEVLERVWVAHCTKWKINLGFSRKERDKIGLGFGSPFKPSRHISYSKSGAPFLQSQYLQIGPLPQSLYIPHNNFLNFTHILFQGGESHTIFMASLKRSSYEGY